MSLKEEWKDLTSTKEIANTDYENDNFKHPIKSSSWMRKPLYYDYLKKAETHKGIIKYDSMGNMHSEKYIKPGFYYENKYYGCSYSEIKRKFNYKYPILAFIFAVIFTFFSCLVFSQIGKFNIEKLFYFLKIISIKRFTKKISA